jgi:signal transduction histidine kinase
VREENVERDTVETAHVIASLAHDLRAPLNAVIGFSHLLLKGIDGPLSELQAADVEVIHTNGDLMLQMVDCLIDLSRAQSGVLKASPTAVHLDALLEKIAKLHANTGKENGVRVTYAVQEVQHELWGDGVLLQRGIERLLGALARLVGQGTIELSAHIMDVHAAIQLCATSTDDLSPDALRALQAYHSGGTSAEHRLDATALCLLVSQELLALNEATLEVGKPSANRVCARLSLPLAASRTGSKLDP